MLEGSEDYFRGSIMGEQQLRPFWENDTPKVCGRLSTSCSLVGMRLVLDSQGV
jgi:hypothetical protein